MTMIITTKAKLKFLRAGRPITIPAVNVTKYRKGRDYAIGLNHRHAICRAQILDTSPSDSTITVRIVDTVNPPRLLTAYSQYGYTSYLDKAMRDEPEAVDRETQKRLTSQGGFRWQQEYARREMERQRIALHERIRELERVQGRGGADVSRQLAGIRRRLASLEQ